MYFRCTTLASILCFLFIGVIGCDDVSAPKAPAPVGLAPVAEPEPAPAESVPAEPIPAESAPEEPAPAEPKPASPASVAVESAQVQAGDRDTHYEQLLSKRLEFQEKISEAMRLYRTTSHKIHEQRTRLKQYLGDKPVSETIELFKKGSEIPSDLRIAYSCWQTLLPDETLRLQLVAWIDKQQVSGILEEFDIQIKEVESRQHLDKLLDREELAKIDRLLAQRVVGWDIRESVELALFEEEAVEKLKIGLENW